MNSSFSFSINLLLAHIYQLASLCFTSTFIICIDSLFSMRSCGVLLESTNLFLLTDPVGYVAHFEIIKHASMLLEFTCTHSLSNMFTDL